jgi:hypothetical protein
MSHYKHSPETLAKMSAEQKRAWETPTTRENNANGKRNAAQTRKQTAQMRNATVQANARASAPLRKLSSYDGRVRAVCNHCRIRDLRKNFVPLEGLPGQYECRDIVPCEERIKQLDWNRDYFLRNKAT